MFLTFGSRLVPALARSTRNASAIALAFFPNFGLTGRHVVFALAFLGSGAPHTAEFTALHLAQPTGTPLGSGESWEQLRDKQEKRSRHKSAGRKANTVLIWCIWQTDTVTEFQDLFDDHVSLQLTQSKLATE
jgi:hypothetical protein